MGLLCLILLLVIPSAQSQFCCFWPRTPDRCETGCVSSGSADNWCHGSQWRCESRCGHVWCPPAAESDDATTCGIQDQCGEGICECETGVCCDNGNSPGQYFSCQQDAGVCAGAACPASRTEPCTVLGAPVDDTPAPSPRPATAEPTPRPTGQPTPRPSSAEPTLRPTSMPTRRPSGQPTPRPSTAQPSPTPTRKPTTAQPSPQPSPRPSPTPTARPSTARPTPTPTRKPATAEPTPRPTVTPSPRPTEQPTPRPQDDTSSPSPRPTSWPTPRPTPRPVSAPSPSGCCWWPETPDRCNACQSFADPANPSQAWCAAGASNCGVCNGVWCDGSAPPEEDDDSCLPPAADPVDATGFATAHGKLTLDGVQLVDVAGAPVQLLGMSSHGLHWFPDCYTLESLTHLVETWGVNLFRAAMYIGEDGYATDPSIYEKVEDIVAWTKQLGIYVIIDWHVLNPGDPNDATYSDAISFWTDVATSYKDEDHVLYEIANEPNGVDWADVLTYHNAVISAIRAVDPETIIIAGTTTWSQDVDLAAADPVDEPYNVMYTFHFYACSHLGLLPRVREYRTQIPIFVSEWGSSDFTGDGGVCVCEAKEFLDTFSDVDGSGGVTLSYAQWSWADKDESSAALAPGSCASGDWDALTESGEFLRDYIRGAASAAAGCAIQEQCGPGVCACAGSAVCCDNGGAPNQYFSCQQDAAMCAGPACPEGRSEPCTVVA